MRWDGDETQARAEAEDCIILLLPAAAATLSPTPTPRHLFGSPALVTVQRSTFISPPFLFLFSYSFHPLSSFQTHPVPQPCSPPSTGTELPSRATPIEIPDRGKFDQILYIHMVKLSLIYILPGNCHPLFLSPTPPSPRCLALPSYSSPVSARTVTVTLISDDLNTPIYFRLLTAFCPVVSTAPFVRITPRSTVTVTVLANCPDL